MFVTCIHWNRILQDKGQHTSAYSAIHNNEIQVQKPKINSDSKHFSGLDHGTPTVLKPFDDLVLYLS